MRANFCNPVLTDQPQTCYNVEAGVESSLTAIPEAKHGGAEFDTPEMRDLIAAFFTKHLR